MVQQWIVARAGVVSQGREAVSKYFVKQRYGVLQSFAYKFSHNPLSKYKMKGLIASKISQRVRRLQRIAETIKQKPVNMQVVLRYLKDRMSFNFLNDYEILDNKIDQRITCMAEVVRGKKFDEFEKAIQLNHPLAQTMGKKVVDKFNKRIVKIEEPILA